MQKEHYKRIMTRALIALCIPFLGQLFVPGWNWGIGEFVFAWVFFVVFGVVYTATTRRMKNRRAKVAAGMVVIAVFAALWGMLATG